MIKINWGNDFLSESVQSYTLYRAAAKADVFKTQSLVKSGDGKFTTHTFNDIVSPQLTDFIGIRSVSKDGFVIDSVPMPLVKHLKDPEHFWDQKSVFRDITTFKTIETKDFPLFHELDLLIQLAPIYNARDGLNSSNLTTGTHVHVHEVDGVRMLFSSKIHYLFSSRESINYLQSCAFTRLFYFIESMKNHVFEHNGKRYSLHVLDVDDFARVMPGINDVTMPPYTGVGLPVFQYRSLLCSPSRKENGDIDVRHVRVFNANRLNRQDFPLDSEGNLGDILVIDINSITNGGAMIPYFKELA